VSVTPLGEAWQKWAEEHRSDIDVNWIAMTVKDAFFAGWEAAFTEMQRRCDEAREAIDGPHCEGVKGPVT
jgi:hypothetical protein